MIRQEAFDMILRKGMEVCSSDEELDKWRQAVSFCIPIVERDAFSKMRHVAEMNEFDAKRRVKNLPDYLQNNFSMREKYFSAIVLMAAVIFIITVMMWMFK